MLLITDINNIPQLEGPCGLTIGNFDGVHLGHQALLKALRSELPPDGMLITFTFSNHPSQYFTPNTPVSLISPPLQKVKCLGDYGVEMVILIPFTEEFSLTPFDSFLSYLKERLNFTHLTLGKGATFGKGREGNEKNVRQLSHPLGFSVDYLPKFLIDGIPVSSGRIRTLISTADFSNAQICMGRPYSLVGHIQNASMDAIDLCLPPTGIYPIRLKIAEQMHLGFAEIAPKEQKIYLNPVDKSLKINNQEVEIFFS